MRYEAGAAALSCNQAMKSVNKTLSQPCAHTMPLLRWQCLGSSILLWNACLHALSTDDGYYYDGPVRGFGSPR
jgi:hypothetical protein